MTADTVSIQHHISQQYKHRVTVVHETCLEQSHNGSVAAVMGKLNWINWLTWSKPIPL